MTNETKQNETKANGLKPNKTVSIDAKITVPETIVFGWIKTGLLAAGFDISEIESINKSNDTIIVSVTKAV